MCWTIMTTVTSIRTLYERINQMDSHEVLGGGGNRLVITYQGTASGPVPDQCVTAWSKFHYFNYRGATCFYFWP